MCRFRPRTPSLKPMLLRSTMWPRGVLFRRVAAEDFILLPEDETFDIVFAVRLGALDGRHPEPAATTPRTDPVAAIGPGWRLRAPGKSCCALGSSPTTKSTEPRSRR